MNIFQRLLGRRSSSSKKTCPPGCVPVPNKDGTYMWCACTDENGRLVYKPMDEAAVPRNTLQSLTYSRSATPPPTAKLQDCGKDANGETIWCDDCDAPLCGLAFQQRRARRRQGLRHWWQR